MRITHVKAECYAVPVDVPRLERKLRWTFTVVRVETDVGLTGHGICGPNMATAIRAFVNNDAARLLNGRDPLRTELLWDDLYRSFNARAQNGVWSSAVSAIDIACWDIKGKFLGQPVAMLLGGARDRVPAYVTYGLAEYSTDELVAVAESLVEQGHHRLKIVVGGFAHLTHSSEARLSSSDSEVFRSLVKEDAKRVKAVRDAVGDNVDLIVDANRMFSSVDAGQLCKLIEPFGIAWFEEPVLANDHLLLQDIRRQTSIPIAAGQNFGNVWQHRNLIANGSVDICQPNVCGVGGYTEALKVAHLARAFNLPIANGGGWPFHNLHLHAAVPNGWLVEFHWPTWKACEMVFSDTPLIEGDWVTVPNRPGLGFEPRHDVLKEYRID